MRTFELSTRVKAVSRGDGRSATAAAAYRACCAITCELEGRTHDYSRKQGLDHAEIVLPEGSPAWAADRVKLWNAAELRETNKDPRSRAKIRAKAKTAREFFFSFPAELSAAGRIEAARTIARHLATAHGIAADFAIHQPGKDGDDRNFHCHMLTTTRRLTAKGLGDKAREWDDLKTGPKLAKEMRAFIAATLNARLKEEGQDSQVHVEHRSFKERGSGQKPQRHQGPERTHMLRKQLGRDRRIWLQQARQAQRDRHGMELAALKLRQDFGLQAKLADIERRGREGEAAIRRELEAARAADKAPAGLRRGFLAVTGRAGREAFGREAREAARTAEAEGRIAALKVSLQAERNAYTAAQGKERAGVAGRHGAEDQQLRQALASREQLDRAREVTARQPEQTARTLERDRQQERGGRSPGPEFSP